MLRISTPKYTFLALCASLLFLAFLYLSPSGAEEKTPPYSPEGSRETKKLAPNQDAGELKEGLLDKDVRTLRTEEYIVKEGDWIAKILKKKGALSDHTLPELLEVLRKLNQSLKDMNMIRPGEKIVILVKVLPSEEGEKTTMPGKRSASAPLKRLKSEAYKVKRGDILSRLAISRYDLSARQFNREYLKLFKKCNPSVQNPDHIMYGQRIRLPLYPPQFEEGPDGSHALRDLDKSPSKVPFPLPESVALQVKEPPPETMEQAKARPKPPKPSVPPPSTKPKQAVSPGWSDQKITLLVAEDLGSIISQMGEEWIHSGERFIPLKSSGHINLKAESYPIIRLNKGMTVIVDLHGALSNKMAKVIESSWASYRVVSLSTNDDLRSAIDKLLRAFNYPKIFKKG
ncbi:MAG: LysM peptidoglycan-binding domain-containing protein, partial [Desulfobacteraceae bacterium]|nr:LysM peptidoglycan-binding domain-containing protein [Desulfobacteraceae bacterium]